MDAVPAADLIDRGSPIRSWFQLAARKTNIGREILAGLTTFATMSYILVVNSAILSSVGIDTGVLISVTALAAALNTALMALVTNYPLALAPGMGSNAFLAYQVCSAMHIPWQAAFGLVFYNGILFLIRLGAVCARWFSIASRLHSESPSPAELDFSSRWLD